MQRDIHFQLLEWKNDSKRKPLLLRGARQVGKTWIIRHFGKSNFKAMVEINFELQPQLKSCFETLEPSEILLKIELALNIDVDPAGTLFFLDEIQECPEAIKALRYFHEKMPNLPVIAAGSLLEFALQSKIISMPVGRIQNGYMNPLSFGEFLSACNEIKLRNYLRTLDLKQGIPEAINDKCIRLLKTYLYLGGMPASVDQWIDSGILKQSDPIHQSLLRNFRDDFGKYGKKADSELLEKVLLKSPAMAGSSYKYSSVDPDKHSRDIRQALDLLVKARLLYKVHSTSGSGLPMSAHLRENCFKVLLVDTGLLQAAMGISSDTYLSDNLLAVYRGAVAEHYVGQQLMTLFPWYQEPLLYFWHRDKTGSEAEVDYLWQHGGSIIPVEVKAGTAGTLKSLKIFLAEKGGEFGVRFSLHPLSYHDQVLSIPLYAVEALPGLIEQVRKAA